MRSFRRSLSTLLPTVILLGGPVAALAETSPRVAAEVREATAGGGRARFWVRLRNAADLSGAAGIADWRLRGEFVHRRLREAARAGQDRLARLLADRGVPHESFWIVNALLVEGTAEDVALAARLPEVERIEPSRTFSLPLPAAGAEEAGSGGVEWNVAAVGAPEAWDRFGAWGQGITVATLDTGVQHDHPALAASYRGRLPDGTYDHAYHWYDPTRTCGGPDAGPCDNVGHGTHVTGTMVGDDGAANRIGVAPGAVWIAAKGCAASYCLDSDLTRAAQWILAPTDPYGSNEDPSRRPHVVNNSWGGLPGDAWFRALVQAWEAAGIFPAFSVGNSGPACGSAGSPGDYPESVATGAFDSLGRIADFSSRGPSSFGVVKPDLAAPGVNIRSSVPGGGYDRYSGTSMASPHTAGAVALLWSAAPGLIGDVAATRAILAQSAADVADLSCDQLQAAGNANNVWGEGRLDALAALSLAPRAPAGLLTGRVSDGADGRPLARAAVLLGGAFSRLVRTDADGLFRATLPEGTWDLSVTVYGYGPATLEGIPVAAGGETVRDVVLDALPRVEIAGRVRDGGAHRWPLHALLRVTARELDLALDTDPVEGTYRVSLVPDQEHTFSVTALSGGYEPEVRVVVPDGAGPGEDFDLRVGLACDAPGYRLRGLVQDFEGEEFPPPGWEVRDNAGLGAVWKRADDWGAANWSGKGEGAATCDSDAAFVSAYDTELRTPTLRTADGTTLVYAANYQNFYSDLLDLDLSAEGGPWINLLSWQEDHGLFKVGPGETVALDLAPYLGEAATFGLRWHYYNPSTFDWDWYAQVDDVRVGDCLPMEGAGLVVARVTDANTGLPVAGTWVADPEGNRSVVTRSPVAVLAQPAGERTLTAAAPVPGYGGRTIVAAISPGEVTPLDFLLPAPRLAVEPPALSFALRQGREGQAVIRLTNSGTASAPTAVRELRLTPGADGPVSGFGAPRLAVGGEGPAPQARGPVLRGRKTAEADGEPPVPVIPGGRIIRSWRTGLPSVWGIGYDLVEDSPWVGETSLVGPRDAVHRFLPGGTATGQFIETGDWVDVFGADMAYDPFTGSLWQVDVGTGTCIWRLDPSRLVSTGDHLCPDLESGQRGLAFDPESGTFFAGTWEDETITRFTREGEVVERVWTGLFVSGLAYNPATGHLFALVNDDSLDVYVLDVRDGYRVVGGFNVGGRDDLPPYAQAGLEMDCRGSLWLVDQDLALVLEAESGEAGVCDWMETPWLAAAPAVPQVEPGGFGDVVVSADARDLAPGVHRSRLLVPDGPYGNLPVPVELTVLPNAPPVIVPPGDRTVAEGEDLFLALSADDPDDMDLLWSASNLPPGAIFDPGEVTLFWRTGYDAAGTYPGVTFRVTDGVSADEVTLTVTVTDTVNPPLFRDRFRHPSGSEDPHWREVRGDWRVARGAFAAPARGRGLALVRGLLHPGAGRWRAKLRLPRGCGRSGAGLVIGFLDRERHRYVRLERGAVVIGSTLPAASYRVADPSVRPGFWLDLEVTQWPDGLVEVRLDGRQAASYRFDFPAAGAAGLLSENAAALFDDVEISDGSVLTTLP